MNKTDSNVKCTKWSIFELNNLYSYYINVTLNVSLAETVKRNCEMHRICGIEKNCVYVQYIGFINWYCLRIIYKFIMNILQQDTTYITKE